MVWAQLKKFGRKLRNLWILSWKTGDKRNEERIESHKLPNSCEVTYLDVLDA
jgi:hypothetical protein